MTRELRAVLLAAGSVLLLTAVAVWVLAANEAATEQARTDRALTSVTAGVEDEMRRLEDVGRDLAVTLTLVDDLDARSYEQLLEEMALDERYPALVGANLVERIPRDEVADHLAGRAGDGPAIELFDDPGEDPVRVVTLVHPDGANAPARGLVVDSQPISRDAHAAAEATGRASLSEAMPLVQLADGEPGAVLVVPVVEDDEVAANLSLVVSGPRFLREVAPAPDLVAVRLSESSPDGVEELAVSDGFDPEARLGTTTFVPAGEREWTVEAAALPGFGTPLLGRGSTLLAFGGALAAVLIGLLVRSTALRERRANELADERTRELSNLTDQLLSANTALADASRTKDEFLASVSHELRTPLTVISGFTESMQRFRPDDEDLGRYLQPIDRNVRRLDALVEDLLTLVSLDAGAATAFVEPIDLAALLRRAPVELAGIPVNDARIDVPDELWVDADRRHLERVLTNLLVNAKRHGAPPIEVTAERLGRDRVEVRIRDHGPGIPADERETVFERFGRGRDQDGTTGTGLGLTIVRDLLELGGGDVRYDDSHNGAGFVLRLPAVSTPGSATSTAAPGTS